MGSEVGETAQAMVTFVLAVLSSLATQIQLCSHTTASSMHDQVMTCGENICNGVPENEHAGEVVMGPLMNEDAAGLGPIRSQIKRTIQGVSLHKLVEIAKTKLISPHLPPAFQRLVRMRDLTKRHSVYESGVEDLLFATEVNMEMVPEGALEHVRQGYQPLRCQEKWRVESAAEGRASIEISNSPTNSAVNVVIRIDVLGGADAQGHGRCDIDSRLYAKPRNNVEFLPRGLVETLAEVHHMQSENLRDTIIALAAASGDEPAAAVAPVPMASAGPGGLSMGSMTTSPPMGSMTTSPPMGSMTTSLPMSSQPPVFGGAGAGPEQPPPGGPRMGAGTGFNPQPAPPATAGDPAASPPQVQSSSGPEGGDMEEGSAMPPAAPSAAPTQEPPRPPPAPTTEQQPPQQAGAVAAAMTAPSGGTSCGKEAKAQGTTKGVAADTVSSSMLLQMADGI
jgi:hypothetical protein